MARASQGWVTAVRSPGLPQTGSRLDTRSLAQPSHAPLKRYGRSRPCGIRPTNPPREMFGIIGPQQPEGILTDHALNRLGIPGRGAS